MIRSAIRKSTWKAIYRLLDRVSPVPFDCGTVCGAACCMAEGDVGIYLLPGEDKLHDRKSDWLEWSEQSTEDYDFPSSWKGKVFFVKCKTPPRCPRHLRPMQCRTFPLMPVIGKDGELELIYDDTALPYSCPLIESRAQLSEDFVQATRTVWKHLIKDPLIYDFVKMNGNYGE